jgi:HPt (histidine-containing phosphotransfer) domain-containing protein
MNQSKNYSIDKLLQYVGNDVNQINEMIKIFLDTIPPDIDQIQKMANINDWQRVYEIAHRIKPSIDIFEMNNILEDIKKIEYQAHENNAEGNLDALIKELSEKVNSVILLMQKEIEK